MSEYATLLEELNALPTLAKSEPAPAEQPAPEAAEAAAADAAPEAADAAPEAPEAAQDAAEGESEGEAALEEAEPALAKALEVTLPDGSKAEGFDATPIIEGLQAELALAKAQLAEQGAVIAVSAGLVKSVHGVVAEQGALIKSMQGEIAKLGAQGAGRKGVTLAKAQPAPAAKPAALAYPDIMTKALALQAAGTINGEQVNRIVAYANRGLGVPDDIAPHFAA